MYKVARVWALWAAVACAACDSGEATAQEVPSAHVAKGHVAHAFGVDKGAVLEAKPLAIPTRGDVLGVVSARFKRRDTVWAGLVVYYRCEDGQLCVHGHTLRGGADDARVLAVVDARSAETHEVRVSGRPAPSVGPKPLREPLVMVAVELRREQGRDKGRRETVAFVMALGAKGAATRVWEHTTYIRYPVREGKGKGQSGGGGHETKRMVFERADGALRLRVVEQDFLPAHRARCLRPEPVTRVFAMRDGRLREADAGTLGRSGCR